MQTTPTTKRLKITTRHTPKRYFYIDKDITNKWDDEQNKLIQNQIRKQLKADIHFALENTTTDYVTMNSRVQQIQKDHEKLVVWSFTKLLEELRIKIKKKKITPNSQDARNQNDSQNAIMNQVTKMERTSTNGYLVINNKKEQRSYIKYFFPVYDGQRYFNFPYLDYNSADTESPFITYAKADELAARMKREHACMPPSPSSSHNSKRSSPTNQSKSLDSKFASSESNYKHKNTRSSSSSSTTTTKRVSNNTSSSRGLPFCHICNLFFDATLEEHRNDIHHQVFSKHNKNYQKIEDLFGEIRNDWRDETINDVKPKKKRKKIDQDIMNEISEILGSPPTSDDEDIEYESSLKNLYKNEHLIVDVKKEY
jgi:hypothetical protein